ncbi:unnamed protein product, partial [Phaeothamnion confervicola]
PLKPLSAALLQCKSHIVGAIIFSAFVNALSLSPAIYMMQIYNRVLQSGSIETLGLLSVILILSILTSSVLDWLRSRLMNAAAIQLSNQLSAKILHSDMGATFTAARRAEVMREFDALRGGIQGPAAIALLDLPWAPIHLAIAFLLHPILGELVLAGGAVMFALAWLNERAVRIPSRLATDVSNQSYRWLGEAAAAGPSAPLFGFLLAVRSRHLVERGRALAFQDMAGRRAAMYTATIKFVRSVLQSAVIATAAMLAMGHSLSIGAVVGVSLIAARAFAPIEQLAGAWRQVLHALSAIASLNDLLVASEGRGARLSLPRPRGALDVRAVSTIVAPTNRALLSEISFRADPGDLVAVIGDAGSGKTTLLQALAGIVPASRGSILLDGADIRHWDPSALAGHVGYLSQTPFLISGTVRHNIARWTRGPGDETSDEAVVQAAMAAGVHEKILRLAGGYDTPLGPDGAGISAGEAHLVSLARALYGNPSLVLLDDPDAAFGPIAPEIVRGLVTVLKRARVTVVIAARRELCVTPEVTVRLSGGCMVSPPPDEASTELRPP